MTVWAVDSHVHFHKCFDEGLFFDSCFNNLNKIKSSAITSGMLFFTEGRNENFFNELRSKSKIKSSLKEKTDYVIDEFEQGIALEVRRIEAGMRVVIFPGFQIVTKENLEVLALGVNERIRDGLLIEDTISNVISFGGIPVLPWGFGKWFGNHGKKINEIINKSIPLLFLGDNGGRSGLLPYPNQFKFAECKGIKILPGSDPLPFPREVNRVMSYGFTFDVNLDESKPWLSVKDKFLDKKFDPCKFGKLTSPKNFIQTQLSMQIKKRLNK